MNYVPAYDHDNGWEPSPGEGGAQPGTTPKTLYFLADGLGSTIGLLTYDGRISARYSYDEFGIVQSSKKFDINWPGPDNMYGYTGLEYEYYSDLNYARARYYKAEIGRFISEDSYLGDMLNPQSQNLYAYVHNNPLRYIDPSGFNPVGPSNNAIFDENQWKYLSDLALNGPQGEAQWANEQIKKELYYKMPEGTKNSTTIALPASSAGGTISSTVSTVAARVAGVAGLILSTSGSSRENDREQQNTAYRALTEYDVASLAAGKGIIAKNPDGYWSAMDHILKGSQDRAMLHDPWISTTMDLTVAQGYDSGYGIVAIDLRKVNSLKIFQANQLYQ